MTASVWWVGTVEEAPLPPSGKRGRDAGVPESEIHFLPLHVLICLSIHLAHPGRASADLPASGGQLHPSSGRLWGWTAAPTCTRPWAHHLCPEQMTGSPEAGALVPRKVRALPLGREQGSRVLAWTQESSGMGVASGSAQGGQGVPTAECGP